VIIGGALAAFLYFRRKKPQHLAGSHPAVSELHDSDTKELQAVEARSELQNGEMRSELAGNQSTTPFLAELPDTP
jgi:hypothetical protein